MFSKVVDTKSAFKIQVVFFFYVLLTNLPWKKSGKINTVYSNLPKSTPNQGNESLL